MFQKFTLYEESVRTPLIVASLGDCLGLEKGLEDSGHLVSGVDLHATICDYAGFMPPEETHGSSVKALAEGRSVPWREAVYIESNYWGRAIVTRRHKFITEYRPKEVEDYVPPGPDSASPGREQLFDLEADPWETRSLAGDPSETSTLFALRSELAKQERTLRRAPLEPGRSRDIVDLWGRRLRARWAAAAEERE